MKDMLTASVLRVSTAGDGAQAVGDSFLGSISPDARYVAFSSGAANLVAGDTNAAFDVFVKNVQTGTIDIVSRSTAGVLGNADSAYAAMSADNGVVAIHSNAGNLVSGDSNGLGDTFTRVFRDCNANDQIDALEGDPGSISCGNGIPDECEPDCNGNAAPDACDIAAGTSQDADGNSIPDECAAAGNGDLNLDGLTNGADIMAFTACYISGSAAGPCAPADMDGDGDVDESDAALFTAALLGA
jgi:hypothetical protein